MNLKSVKIATTQHAALEDVRRGREAGRDEHLTKPVDFSRIESTIDRVLQQFRQSGRVTESNGEKP